MKKSGECPSFQFIRTGRRFLFLLLFISARLNHLYAQDTVYFSGIRNLLDSVSGIFKENHSELTFFKYHLISTSGNVYDYFKGNIDTDSTTEMLTYLNTVKEVGLSNFNPEDSSVSIVNLEKRMLDLLDTGYTPISLTFVEYSDFKDSTIALELVGFENNAFTETQVSEYYPFEKKRLFTGSVLNHVIKNPTQKFFIDEKLIQSNIREEIDSLYIDFDDSNGFIPVELNQAFSISYNSEGLKNCVMKIKAAGDYYYSKFQIYDSTLNFNSYANSLISSVIQPDIGPEEIETPTMIHGHYAVWLAPCHSSIIKPYIVVSGFNPGHGKQLVPFQWQWQDIVININGNVVTIPLTYGWRGTYYETYNGVYNKRFSQSNTEGDDNGAHILDRLRDEGYDIIIMMNDNGVDYIERTAELVEALINRINYIKFGNGSYIENVVCGVSAGGVASRLALANMEAKYKQGLGPHPHTKMWVSMETENQGANVPLGFQYLVDFQANPNNLLPAFTLPINAIQVAADWVNWQVAQVAQGFNQSVTARQLTLYTPSSPTGPQAVRTNLLNTFANVPYNTSGYPDFVRRVGISQGSAVGSVIPHSTDKIFDSQLKMNPNGDSYSETDCKGSYTVYEPVAKKTTTARWWSSISNGQNIFDGNVMINETWTYMKRQCTVIDLGNGPQCYCIGPFVMSGYSAVIANQHIQKPSTSIAVNHDDVPGSTQSVQHELYHSSAYPFYNNWFAGNSFASYDTCLHNFAPTVSGLDLHDPNTGLPSDDFSDPVTLGLMNINKIGAIINQHPDKRFGFPYLQYPTNPHLVTPFDAVFAIGNNNGVDINNIARPDNQYHVEDPQVFIGDYLARYEVAPTDLFISNIVIGGSAAAYSGYSWGYVAEIEARNKIIAGKTDINGGNIYALYSNLNYLTPNADVRIATDTKAILHCGDQIELLPGFEVPYGAELDSYILAYPCSNNRYRRSKYDSDANAEKYSEIDAIEIGKIKSEKDKTIELFPNPSKGGLTLVSGGDWENSDIFVYDLQGNTVYRQMISGNEPATLELDFLANGLYLLQVRDKRFKIIIAK
jgi:hypothetical protein